MSIHVGDTPRLECVVLENNTPLNISGYDERKLYLKKPDGSVVERTVSFLTDGTDGILKYEALTSDFDTVGFWKRQWRIRQSASGKQYATDAIEFEVKGVLGSG